MHCILCDKKWGDEERPTVCNKCGQTIGGMFIGSITAKLVAKHEKERKLDDNKTSSSAEKLAK